MLSIAAAWILSAFAAAAAPAVNANANATRIATTPDATTPDIIPRGYRSIRVDRKTDLSALAEHCCVQHRIAKGETLSKIAREQLGDIKRLQEIVDLNPGLVPDKLAIGTRIWLPPRNAASKAPLRFAFHAQVPNKTMFRPLAHSDQLHSRYGSFQIALVPAGLLKPFSELRQMDYKAAEKWLEEHKKTVEVIPGSNTGSTVPNSSAVHRMEETLIITRDTGGKFAIKSRCVGYGDDNKVIGNDEKKDKRAAGLWLLALAGLGAAFVWWRTRTAAPSREAASPAPDSGIQRNTSESLESATAQ